MIFSAQDYLNHNTTFEADAVVVGTGAGGATIGAELARHGLDVLFVEEGSYIPTSSFNPYMEETGPRLLRDSGATMILGLPPIQYAEGKCLGGSTVVNGGMTYRPPDPILEKWARATKDPSFLPKNFHPILDQVGQIIHAEPQLDCSVGDDSKLMLRGAQKLGWHSEINRRNQHFCVGANNCVFGCTTGAKQSTLVSYMPIAIKHNARVLTEARASRLLIKDHRCIGIQAHSFDPHTRKAQSKITVLAKITIIAGGAIQTPHLLLKHKLGRPSKLLGKHFLCHPNAKVAALYPFDVYAWKGVSQYSQVREFRDQGILMAENFIPPSVVSGTLPFLGQQSWEIMKDYNRLVTTGVLVEDSTTGRIFKGPLDTPIPFYQISAYDHHRFIKGIKALASIHFEMGAQKVFLPFEHLPVISHPDQLKNIKSYHKSRLHLELFTMHLMGTAKMGSTPRNSVINTSGELWDLPGCFVADASAFPSAIGVNPQWTIMALATLISQKILDRWNL